MARYTGAVCRLCRREGAKLFLKSERCYLGKCPLDKRVVAPGEHGQSRRKLSEYGLQLREKQKARRIYGVLEGQFRRYFERATRKKGVTGSLLLQFLELRLDNIVFRAGFAGSRAQARQIVRHGHIKVNGRRVNIPSYSVRPGDQVIIDEKSRDIPQIKEVLEAGKARSAPLWLEVDRENCRGTILRLPEREEIDVPIQEHLIVELYSK